jgi:Holliday junction DNA helicase RuvA
MIDFIRGTLIDINTECAIVETHGVGYKIHIPVNLYFKSPKVGDTIVLFTSAIYREDSQRLFGFLTRSDQATFEKLLQVTGIGPKLALSLIGHLDSKQLEAAIVTSDSNSLSKIPGIGKKTAERMILELKDKIKKTKDSISSQEGITQDATQALVHLGYPQKEAYQLIQKALKIDSSLDLANLIKRALQQAATS